MEKISIVRRRHRSRELETTALVRARIREQHDRLENVAPDYGRISASPGVDSAEEFCFEVELTPEQVHKLKAEHRNGGGRSSPGKAVIFRFNITRPENSEMLTSGEVCRILRISRRTLYRYVKSDELKAFRVGGGLRFMRRDVLGFLAECRISETEP